MITVQVNFYKILGNILLKLIYFSNFISSGASPSTIRPVGTFSTVDLAVEMIRLLVSILPPILFCSRRR